MNSRQYFCQVLLVLQVLLISKITQVRTLFFYSLQCLQTFVIQVDPFVTVCIPDLLKEFLKFACTHSLYCKVLWVFTNAYCHVFTITVSYRIVYCSKNLLWKKKNPETFASPFHPPPLFLNFWEPVIFLLPPQFCVFQNVTCSMKLFQTGFFH